MSAPPSWIPAVVVIIIALFNLGAYALNERSLLWRALAGRSRRRRGLLLASNTAAGVPRGTRPRTFWCLDLLSPADLYTPSFGGSRHGTAGLVAGLALAAFRSLGVVIFVFAVAYEQATYPGGPRDYCLYFTNWTFCLFGAVSAVGATLTAAHALRRRPTEPHHRGSDPSAADDASFAEPPTAQSALNKDTAAVVATPLPASRSAVAPTSPTKRGISTAGGAVASDWGGADGGAMGRWRAIDAAYLIALQTACAASVTLTLFYWLMLYERGSKVRVDNPFKHGASSFLLLVDFALSRTPVVSYHFSAALAWGSVYMVFLWAWWGATGSWVYAALNWSKPAALASYIALPLLLLLAYAIMFLVAWGREAAVTGSCCSCCLGRRARGVASDFETGAADPTTAVVLVAPHSPKARRAAAVY